MTKPSAPIYLPRSSVRAYTYDGKPVFIKRRSRDTTQLHPSNTNVRIGNLLDVPIHRLMDDISVIAARRLAAEPRPAGSFSNSSSSDMLWVDQYRPSKYTDLLGDERVHREVLSWVKEWDECVFGRSANTRGKKRARDGDDLPQDKYRRPPEKIMLLSGPPGLGKTTLAHVVAKQAGYNVFEINASDARSAQVVEDRIRPAVEIGFSVGSTKPNLVVIDEIDGATGGNEGSAGFIQKLVQLALEKPYAGRLRKKDRKGKQPLLRPIICICNDLNAQVLSKLRPISRIIRFSKPADFLLVKRLRQICEWEVLQADNRALSTLVGIAQGDMRGCLNTLQFFKARNQTVTETMVRNATVGLKESDANYQVVMNDLFIPMSQKRVKDLGLSGNDQAKYVDRLSRQLDGSGIMDRIALGCFEHYAKIHQHDATFTRYLKGNDWLLSYDTLSGSMHAEREFALLPYLSYCLVPYYPLFQQKGGPRVERPKEYWDNYNKTKASEEVYRSLAHSARSGGSGVGSNYRNLANEPTLHLEFAPYLNRIISPPLRPVNSQVIRPEEKDILSCLVGIMVALELRFVQERSDDGQLVYRLDPPVDVFVTYDGKRASDIGPSRYAIRQLVATEIDARLASKHVEALERSKVKQTLPSLRRYVPAGDFALEGSGDQGDGALASVTSDAPAAKRAKAVADLFEKPALDFFGRPIVAKPASKRPSHAGPLPQGSTESAFRASFRFKEGNSAAVRKPVKMASFM
ncbi:P-loop containing nucleoside triphosphate hydrolase protein [Vararia minispora EC-137]|uniref:P-loop containing nucleoside triphosphate hydrolase protein n=1 Tax=Vararia minispora EC-137 TaxID=1314806 RepID=A0ACB8QKU5_9AGAM|nr:P-loop containing nucleoside triphosphate hydrolase protein [Vararia minispora EC-137]